jgi:hypothetical protein
MCSTHQVHDQQPIQTGSDRSSWIRDRYMEGGCRRLPFIACLAMDARRRSCEGKRFDRRCPVREDASLWSDPGRRSGLSHRHLPTLIVSVPGHPDHGWSEQPIQAFAAGVPAVLLLWRACPAVLPPLQGRRSPQASPKGAISAKGGPKALPRRLFQPPKPQALQG